MGHCDAGAGARCFDARSLMGRGGGSNNASKAVVRPWVWCVVLVRRLVERWRAAGRVGLGYSDEGAEAHWLGEGCLAWGAMAEGMMAGDVIAERCSMTMKQE